MSVLSVYVYASRLVSLFANHKLVGTFKAGAHRTTESASATPAK